jgi:hypothetical protein
MNSIFQALSDSQPLTPVSSSTPDHPDARTPQSVRSLDSEPMVPPSTPVVPVQGPTKPGRKRKVDRNASNTRHHHTTASVTSIEESMAGGNNSTGGLNSSNSTISTSSCAKRQIIVQNDVMDVPSNNHATSRSGHNNGTLTAPVTPGSVGHDSGSSPHHSEADNSGDSARWRKINHQPTPWDTAVRIHMSATECGFF